MLGVVVVGASFFFWRLRLWTLAGTFPVPYLADGVGASIKLESKWRADELMEPRTDEFEGNDVRGSEGSDCSGLSGWSRNSVNEEESEESESEADECGLLSDQHIPEVVTSEDGCNCEHNASVADMQPSSGDAIDASRRRYLRDNPLRTQIRVLKACFSREECDWVLSERRFAPSAQRALRLLGGCSSCAVYILFVQVVPSTSLARRSARL